MASATRAQVSGCRNRRNSEKRTCVTPVVFQMRQPLPLPSNDSDDSNVSTIITPSLAREIFTFPLFNNITKKKREKREKKNKKERERERRRKNFIG